MTRRFIAGLGIGFAVVLVVVSIGTFATDEPLSVYGRWDWINGLLLMFFSQRGARIALSTLGFATAYMAWHFSWKEWKRSRAGSGSE